MNLTFNEYRKLSLCLGHRRPHIGVFVLEISSLVSDHSVGVDCFHCDSELGDQVAEAELALQDSILDFITRAKEHLFGEVDPIRESEALTQRVSPVAGADRGAHHVVIRGVLFILIGS